MAEALAFWGTFLEEFIPRYVYAWLAPGALPEKTSLELFLAVRMQAPAVAEVVPAVAPRLLPTAAKSGIGAASKIGEDALKALGGESQVYFRTSQGGRYVDQLVNGIANESKVGYQSLTPTISRQIAKDVELINSGQIQGSTWHFFQSPVTGMGGPSQPLLNALQQNGINVIIHP
jgi:hypothetical protein